MAKSQRSSRKKALRTQRAEKVTATWAAEADAKRLAALAACMDAAPIPVVNEVVPSDDDADAQQQRGRSGAAGDEMAVDGSSKPSSSASRKQKKMGRKAAGAGAAPATSSGGINKRKKQSAGSKLAKAFNKKAKKQRRAVR